jgi:hypothetical protein
LLALARFAASAGDSDATAKVNASMIAASDLLDMESPPRLIPETISQNRS